MTVTVAPGQVNSYTAGLNYLFSVTTTMADPGAGYVRFNNATIASVTAIAIDDQTNATGNPDLSAFVTTWDDSASTVKGTLQIQRSDAPQNFHIFQVTGLTDNSGWTELAVTYVDGDGSFPADSSLVAHFTRTGDPGAGGGSMSTVKEAGVQLGGADIVTLDFDGDDFNLTESPDTEINVAINKSGSDTTIISGTAGTTNYTAKWNADGDLVDGYEVLDEDAMGSDSDTKLATQQSIKAYVDGAVFTPTDIDTDYGAETVTAAWSFNPSGAGGLTNYDLSIGDTDGSPTYGILRLGNAIFGRTSYTSGSLDLDGSVLMRNVGSPASSNIEFAFVDSNPAIRFALAVSGVGNATYNPRSMLIAGPAVLDDTVVTVGYWQGQGIFDNLVCNTSGDGADLGVQNDLEVEGDIFTDSILGSTDNTDIVITPHGTGEVLIADLTTVGTIDTGTWQGTAVAQGYLNTAVKTGTLTFIIDGGGSAITTGIKGDLQVPFACTVNEVTMLADQSGSIVVDIWNDTYANFPPTDADSITASAEPTITTATKSNDSTLTGWTTSVAADDILRFNVDSVTDIQRLTINLDVTKT